MKYRYNFKEDSSQVQHFVLYLWYDSVPRFCKKKKKQKNTVTAFIDLKSWKKIRSIYLRRRGKCEKMLNDVRIITNCKGSSVELPE